MEGAGKRVADTALQTGTLAGPKVLPEDQFQEQLKGVKREGVVQER